MEDDSLSDDDDMTLFAQQFNIYLKFKKKDEESSTSNPNKSDQMRSSATIV